MEVGFLPFGADVTSNFRRENEGLEPGYTRIGTSKSRDSISSTEVIGSNFIWEYDVGWARSYPISKVRYRVSGV